MVEQNQTPCACQTDLPARRCSGLVAPGRMLSCAGQQPFVCAHGKNRTRRCRGPSRTMTAAAAAQQTAAPIISYTQIELETQLGISLFDITPQIRQRIAELGVTEGCVNVLSRHTTTAIAINEYETRLLDDIRQWLRRMAPPSDPYLHNDLHLREAPEGWPGGHAAWAAQEPENAHSHLLSMMLGNSETIPITGGKLALGTWQSVMLVELDGPRKRTVGIQVMGTTAAAAAGGGAGSG